MKIVVLDMFTLTSGDIGWDEFSAMGEVTCYPGTPDDLRVQRIGDADAVLVNRTSLDRATLEQCPNLKYIGVFATGYNLIDVDAARERGIAVANVPGYSTMAVTQLTLALLLELTNRAGSLDRGVKNGRWTMEQGSCFWDHSLVELSGLTMGLIGYGGIGRAVGEVALALGMRVRAYRKRMEVAPENPGVEYAPLDKILAESDVVSLHVPLNPQTRGIINSAALDQMKKGTFLVNTARGALIVEQDVAEALESGKLAGYGADVTEIEPIPSDSPLLTSPNCVLTPHVGWVPLATRKRLFGEAAKNLSSFFQGKPRNIVNA